MEHAPEDTISTSSLRIDGRQDRRYKAQVVILTHLFPTSHQLNCSQSLSLIHSAVLCFSALRFVVAFIHFHSLASNNNQHHEAHHHPSHSFGALNLYLGRAHRAREAAVERPASIPNANG
jgi:hypothetical protein